MKNYNYFFFLPVALNLFIEISAMEKGLDVQNSRRVKHNSKQALEELKQQRNDVQAEYLALIKSRARSERRLAKAIEIKNRRLKKQGVIDQENPLCILEIARKLSQDISNPEAFSADSDNIITSSTRDIDADIDINDIQNDSISSSQVFEDEGAPLGNENMIIPGKDRSSLQTALLGLGAIAIIAFGILKGPEILEYLASLMPDDSEE